MSIERMIMVGVGILAAAFLVLLALAMVRRERPEGPQLLRAGTGCLAAAGLLFILAGIVIKGDMASVGGGFMFLVLATGIEMRPRKS